LGIVPPGTVVPTDAWENLMTTTTMDQPIDQPDEAPQRRRVAGKVAATIAVLGAAVGIVSVASLALFTDTANVPANTFTTGSVDIATSPTTAVVTMPAMAPGDQVTAPLDVQNNGTLAFRYAMTSDTTENVLAADLTMTIKSGVTTCTNAGFGATGSTLYTGDLGSTTDLAILGNASQGAQAGDRTLAAGASEVLCINVSLPLAATTQSATTTATFTFSAEQTANNP
jgi:predicted ribosomally synthesized peptide with SipW-like signal peptide